ncbi:hypothetical protein [Nonomuraea harbinensis]|uniref:Uncharacterized protein n=1 Tax=Nonomuraea harbinensis TaxID=1286938 RepID=A0ABW1BLJ9_9ACTN|nr:hypothetical protein [Nonomuraea harbinensis]
MKRAVYSALLLAIASFAVTGEGRSELRDPALLAQQWAAFPESRQPRPVVLIGALPEVNKSGGYITRVRLGANLSSQAPKPADVLLADGTASLPQISPIAAYEEVRRHMERRAAPGREGTVLNAEHVTHEFLSDRGLIRLPAWRFQIAGGGSLTWPALSPQAFWRLGSVSSSSKIMRVSADRTKPEITVWMDSGHGCGEQGDERPTVHIMETSDVVIVSTAKPPASLDRMCVSTADFRARPFTYVLSSPLGNRGLLDEAGHLPVVHHEDVAPIPGKPPR